MKIFKRINIVNFVFFLIKNKLSKDENVIFFKGLIIALIIAILNIISFRSFDDSFGDFISYEIPEITENQFFLDEKGFVLKKLQQTQERDRLNQTEIITHLVKKGETLSQISIDYQIKIASLLVENSHINPWKALKVGTKLKILPIDGISIKLEKNISVQEIAKKYNISENILRKQNNFSEDILIVKKGKNIIIPGGKKQRVIRLSNKQSKLLLGQNNFSYSFPTSSYLIRPAKGTITQYFTSFHHGLDIANVGRGPIFASADGVVLKARNSGWNGGYGQVIIIGHGKGLKTLYAHNQKIYVKQGQTIKQGDVIGWMGNSGKVRGRTGIHIHFEVILGGRKVNPLSYIR